jgi:chromate transporter
MLGFINFGGPAGQIAIMHRELVERRRWISDGAFLRGLNFCVLLPGPEAQQLATYIGWRFHGITGGILAGGFFVLPSVVVLLVLTYTVAAYGDVPAVSGLLYGVGPVVVALVVDALIRVGRRTLRHPILVATAVTAYVALEIAGIPFPVVVLLAGLSGLVLRRVAPFAYAGEHGDAPRGSAGWRAGVRRALLVVAAFISLWSIPIGLLLVTVGPSDVLFREAVLFTEAAFVTFGGAYAVLTYIANVAVNEFGWLTRAEMVQGLGFAESTPGPLIMVTQYVGSLAAWKLHGEARLLFLVLGGLVTTYMTFLPSFFLILLAAPYVERIAGDERARAALAGITAAVVGVIAYLATFFGVAVLVPGGRIDPFAIVLAAAAFAVLRLTRIPVPVIVPAGALIGLLRTLL